MDPVDQQTFQWTVGGLVGLVLAAFGWNMKQQAAANSATKDDARTLWEAHSKLADKHHDLERTMLSSMVTKEDIRQMETRIMSAVAELKK